MTEANGDYNLYRQVNLGGYYVINFPNSVTSFLDTNVQYGSNYYYYVKASNDAGEGLKSGTVVGTPKSSPLEVGSNMKPPRDNCNCEEKACGGGGFPGGSSKPDPVNLTTGDESNEPEADLTVYNPSGPSVAFQRTWRTNQARRGYSTPGMPNGWGHNYDVVIEPPATTGSWVAPLYLAYSNGSSDTLTPQVDGSGNPTGAFATTNGAPFVVQGIPGSTVGTWQSITVTWKDRSKWQFTAPAAGANYALTQITDRMGQGITLTYTYTRCLTAITNTQTNATLLTVNYGSDGLIASVVDAYGRKVVYTNTVPTDTNATVLTSVSQMGSSSGSTPAARWTYDYVFVNDQPMLSTVTVPSATGTGTATATMNYDTTGKVASLVDANGFQKVFTYSTGQTQVDTRDALGNLVHTYKLNFDSNYRSTGTTDAASHSTSITYGDSTNPYLPTSRSDEMSRTTQATYDNFGNTLTTTDARSVTTTYTYDYTAFPLGRLLSVQEGTKPATTYTYYEPSGLVASVTGPSPTGSGTVTTNYTYDALGNVLTVVAPGNSTASTMTTTMNYSSDGTYSQTPALGQPLTVTDNLGHTSHMRYDAQGRPVSTWDALGNQTDTTYNIAGQTLTVQMPATGQTGTGRGYTQNTYLYVGGPISTSKIYDESNVLVRQVTSTYGPEGEPQSVTGSTEPFAKEYDALYRITKLYDGNNHATTYTYDAVGHIASVQMPGSETTTFPSYDYSGRLLQRVDGNSVVTNYTYNDLEGKLTDIAYPASTGLNAHFTYDSYGRQTGVTDSTGSRSRTFGDLDELVSETTTYTGLSAKTLSYTYNADGSRASMTTPAGTFSATYDAAGRPVSMTNPFSQTTAWTYSNNDWLATQTLHNGVVTTYTNNALGQLTGLQNALGTTTLSQFNGIVHDGAGNRLSVTANLPTVSAFSGTTTYQYDSKDQLTQEASTRASSYTNTFGYDAAGNPTTFKGATRTYNSNNQLTSGTSFVYDGNGNPTTYNGVGLTFDPENKATVFGTVLTAGYRIDGVRAWKQNTATSAKTYFLYDGTTPVIELDATGSVSATNTFGANGLISRTVGTSTVYYTFDERGTTAQRLDASGSVLSSHMADAFGTMASTSATTDPYDGFGAQSGYYTDHETGLVLCTFRYYDPSTGRWLTRDPISYDGGINLYGYSRNNPIMDSDPLGLDPPHGVSIYGRDDHDVGKNWGWTFNFSSPPGNLKLYKPTRAAAIAALIQADSIYYWGHGGPLGLWYNDHQALHEEDLIYIMKERKKIGKGKFKEVVLDSCESAATGGEINIWLKYTEEFQGVIGLTWDSEGWGRRFRTRRKVNFNPVQLLKSSGFDPVKFSEAHSLFPFFYR